MPKGISAPYLDELGQRFDRSVENLRRALHAFIQDGTRPDPDARASGAFVYPEIRIR